MTRLPTLLAGLGLVGVLFGILSFALALFGAPTDLVWIAGNLLVGVALLVAAAVQNFDALRERMASGEARRAGRYGSSALLGVLFSIGIAGMLGFLAVRYPLRFDWTEQSVHSLSEQSRKLLAGLDRDVEVLALFGPLDAPPVRELLDRYAYESERFRVQFADPNERPDLLERYGITPDKLGNGLVRIAMGDESVEIQELTEENVTNAMVKLSRTAAKRIYFLVGHNERAIDGEAAQEREGFGRAADALRNENYQVETLLLAAKGEVPEDANAVIAPGATRPLLDAEHAALRRYLERGGALMVLLDPRAKTDLVDDVVAWGVDVGDDIIVDRQLALFGRATTPFASQYDPSHEITRGLRDPTLFHVARSVRHDGDAAGAGDGPGGQFTEIVFTGQSSWAERNLDQFFSEGSAELGDDDVAGPVSVAVAGTPRLEGGGEDAGKPAGAGRASPRLVVFGDSDFASNELIEAYRNRDLFVNAVNWLLGDVEAISIRPNRSRASRFQLTAQQFQRIRSLSLFVLPELIAVAGVLTWWSRRRAPAP